MNIVYYNVNSVLNDIKNHNAYIATNVNRSKFYICFVNGLYQNARFEIHFDIGRYIMEHYNLTVALI
jgi:predicted RNase H-related nuclease YkuK (DUF458 family)